MATTILIFVEHLKSIFKHTIMPQNKIISSRHDSHIGCDTFIHKRLPAYREELAVCANSHTSAMRKVYDKRSPSTAGCPLSDDHRTFRQLINTDKECLGG